MTVQLFIELLTIFSVLTSLCVEAEKTIASEQEWHYSANLMALVTALIVGIVGTSVYYILTHMAFDVQNIICMILMGFASGLASMVGFDKMKQLMEQIAK